MSRTFTISASEFEAHCLESMDRVHDSGSIVTITKRGKPVARLGPLAPETTALFASLPVKIVRDIVGRSGGRWDAER